MRESPALLTRSNVSARQVGLYQVVHPLATTDAPLPAEGSQPGPSTGPASKDRVSFSRQD
jgi:hypothetical protein